MNEILNDVDVLLKSPKALPSTGQPHEVQHLVRQQTTQLKEVLFPKVAFKHQLLAKASVAQGHLYSCIFQCFSEKK